MCKKRIILLLISVLLSVINQAQNTSVSTQLKVAVFKKDFLNCKIDYSKLHYSSGSYKTYQNYKMQRSVVCNPEFNKSWVCNTYDNSYPKDSKFSSYNSEYSEKQTDHDYPVVQYEYRENQAWGEFIAYTLYQLLYLKK